MVAVLLYVLAVVLLTLAGFGVRAGRVHFGWLGLAIVAFTALILPELTG